MESHSHSIYQVTILTHFVYYTVTESLTLVTENGNCMQLTELKIWSKKNEIKYTKVI